MVQQIAVQAPVTFRRGYRRKQIEKYKDSPNRERKIMGNTLEKIRLQISR